MKKIVSFSSLPDFSDNSRAFFDYLMSLEEKGVFENHRFIWHVNNAKELQALYPKVDFVQQRTLKSVILFFESDYVIKTHGFYESLGKDERRKEILLFHGMPVKRIGYQNEDDIKYGVLKADYYTVTSAFYKKVFEESFHADPKQILITGMPRNDLLFSVPTSVKNRIHTLLGERIVIFLPTFRKCNLRDTEDGVIGNSDLSFGGNRAEWEALDKVLHQNNVKLIIKPHPMDAAVNRSIIKRLDNVRIINDDWLKRNGVMLYQLLESSEKLITDYSSVYIDYLLLDKPICFFMPDFDGYKNTRGLVFENPLEWLPGHICYHFKDISAFITEPDSYGEKRKQVNSVLNNIHDGTASSNTFKALNSLINL